MTNQRIANRIAKQLAEGLVHPGYPEKGVEARPLVLPAFRTVGMPPQVANLVAETTKLLSEAIVALIETDCEIIDRDELARLRYSADEDAQKKRRPVPVHCKCDTTRSNPLLVLTVDGTERIVIDGKQLIKGLSARSVECPHTVKSS